MIEVLTMISLMISVRGGVPDPSPESLCTRIGEIRSIPMKGPGSDEVYQGLMQAGNSAVPCLLKLVTDTTPMPDPRMAPTYSGIVVGDIAVFILARITEIKLETMLPEPARTSYETEGVYAYFDYVSEPSHRLNLQQRWRDWLVSHADEGIQAKKWHLSPSSDPLMSVTYPVVTWTQVENIRIGMCQKEVEATLGASLQYYHHPINAIVFSIHPEHGPIEVAFRLTDDNCIADVSYKLELP